MKRDLDPIFPSSQAEQGPSPYRNLDAPVLLGGRYQVETRIASGGMAEVFQARDTVLGRRVAVKVLHASYSADAEFVERFRKEAMSAGRLNHPNVVQVYDWGSENGRSFMVMELIEGQTLREVLNERGALAPSSVARIAGQVCSALEAARVEGIVHRDIKPENILISNEARVKVADFGVARALAESRVTQAGLVIGTASYLAPEQVEGKPSDHRADIYSLGTCMFEMVAGEPPFTGDNPVVVAYRRVKEDVPHLGALLKGIPDALDLIVARATARSPEDRYASAAEMSEDLIPLIGEGEGTRVIPIGSAPTQVIRRRVPRTRYLRRRILVTGVTLLVLLAGSFFTLRAFAKTTVPDVRNLSQLAATHLLERAGFKVETSLINDPTVPAGSAVGTIPSALSRASHGSKVILSISLGPKIVTVPYVVGQPEAQAIKDLTSLNLKVITKLAYDAITPKGNVVSQTPQPDVSITEGRSVTIVVSEGVEQVTVPAVKGLNANAAVSTLHRAGFTFTIKRAINDTVPKNVVISSSPVEGTKAPKGSSVTLVVSNGPSSVTVPDVTRMAYANGASIIVADGLNAVRSQVPGSIGDTIVSEDPPAGSKQKRGTTITLYTT
ncbi:MAG: Stk1 family PASTA domain-containing Ser/Thr kinase [Actinomycetota bacterium]